MAERVHWCEVCNRGWSCEGQLCSPCDILPPGKRPGTLICPECAEQEDLEERSYYDR